MLINDNWDGHLAVRVLEHLHILVFSFVWDLQADSFLFIVALSQVRHWRFTDLELIKTCLGRIEVVELLLISFIAHDKGIRILLEDAAIARRPLLWERVDGRDLRGALAGTCVRNEV